MLEFPATYFGKKRKYLLQNMQYGPGEVQVIVLLVPVCVILWGLTALVSEK